jgi:hypothetical protein
MINQTPTPDVCERSTLLEHTAMSCGIICVRRVDFDDVDKCMNARMNSREQIFAARSRFIMFRVIWLKTATRRVWIERRGVASCGESFSFIRKRQAAAAARRDQFILWISKVRDAQNLIDRALGALFMRT